MGVYKTRVTVASGLYLPGQKKAPDIEIESGWGQSRGGIRRWFRNDTYGNGIWYQTKQVNYCALILSLTFSD